MWYAITGTDNPDSQTRRQSVRSAHLERLKQLHGEGRLLLAGPFPAVDAEDPGAAGFTGSLIVAEFENLAAAKAWADADPYIGAGVYREVRVQPFRKVLP
ncbi:MAG TPA: YciI family protein [Rhodanobacteraceae bacterium]|nr:YciI family protein [Rhodanobacteraceae bacterium]